MNNDRRILVAVAIGLVSFLVLPRIEMLSAESPEASKSDNSDDPRYTKEGLLHRPKNFREWVFVGASLGLSYAKEITPHDEQMFHNVYLNPNAYRQYVETGTFPDKTMLAMTVYRQEKKSIAPQKLGGSFEGDLVALEVAVKDSERFDEEWAYFDFKGGKSRRETAKPFLKAFCYDCHAEHAADDNVFVQFYPVLRRAKQALESKK